MESEGVKICLAACKSDNVDDTRLVSILKNVMKETKSNHSIVFDGPLFNDKLFSIEEFKIIADRVIGDDGLNWGKIISLLIFISDYVEDKNESAKIFDESTKLWIADNGGWKSAIDFFDKKNNWFNRIKEGLFNTFTFGTIMATLYLVTK